MPAVRATITVVTPAGAVSYVNPIAAVELDPLARNPVADDGLRLADAIVVVMTFRRLPADAVGTTDTRVWSVSKTLADTVGATDDLGGALSLDDDQTMVFAKTASDSGLIADAINSRLVAKPASDGSSAGDAALRNFAKTSVDSTVSTDQTTRALAKSISDSPKTTDLLSRVATFVRSYSDTYQTSDTGAAFKQNYAADPTYFAEFYTGTGSTW